MLLQSANDFFRRNVSDEHVLREWASAQSTDGRIEAPAPSLERSQHLCTRCGARAVHMNSYLAFWAATQRRRYDSMNPFRLRSSDCIRQRNCADSHAEDRSRRFHDLLFGPRVAIRVTECH